MGKVFMTSREDDREGEISARWGYSLDVGGSQAKMEPAGH